MTEETEIGTHEEPFPTVHLRFVERQIPTMYKDYIEYRAVRILQQKWIVYTISGAVMADSRVEWRDVPLEVETND